jgi:hypothetical protein
MGKLVTLDPHLFMLEKVIIPNTNLKKGSQPTKTAQGNQENTGYRSSSSCC